MFQKHRVPAETIQAPGFKWNYAWHIGEVFKLGTPAPYTHLNGRITWATLCEEDKQTLALQCAEDIEKLYARSRAFRRVADAECLHAFDLKTRLSL
jgi:hypothetical protein